MISNRIKNMTPSATVALTAKVSELRSKGIDVVAFNVGEPDFNTPANIIAKGKEAMDKGLTKYTPCAGLPELKKAICKKFENDNNVKYEPDEIIVSGGAKQSLINTIMAICNDGDEIIILSPYWVSYTEQIKLAGGIPVEVKLDESKGFALNVEDIRAKITDRTVAVMVNSPSNPTGAVFSGEDLEALGKLAVEKDFWIISDEVYEKLIYDDAKHYCIASFSQEIKNKTIVINAVSKAYSMTGWRIGYAAGPKEVIKAMNSYQGHTTSNASSIGQYASIEALLNSEAEVEKMRLEFDKRRMYIVNRLNNMKGITYVCPKGAFYVMPNISAFYGKKYGERTINTSLDMADYLLEEGKIALVPGEAFDAPDNIRISYSNSMDNIKKGMDRMEECLAKLK